MWLYADGVELNVENEGDWTKAGSVSMPADTHVVGIKCEDFGVAAGIKAAFSNGVKTDNTWKCSTQASPGWNLEG